MYSFQTCIQNAKKKQTSAASQSTHHLIQTIEQYIAKNIWTPFGACSIQTEWLCSSSCPHTFVHISVTCLCLSLSLSLVMNHFQLVAARQRPHPPRLPPPPPPPVVRPGDVLWGRERENREREEGERAGFISHYLWASGRMWTWRHLDEALMSAPRRFNGFLSVNVFERVGREADDTTWSILRGPGTVQLMIFLLTDASDG